MNKILFYHGGPGLNGNPERNILTDLYKQQGFELCVWDEPSAMRPAENNNYLPISFKNYCKSSEDFLLNHYNGEPLIIAGHSFGTFAVANLLVKHPEKIIMVLFISPGFYLFDADRDIFSFVKEDYEINDAEKAKAMQGVLDNFSGSFDDNAVNGWMLAASNPRLFNYYWHNNITKDNFLQYYMPPNYSLDAEGFFAIRKTWYELTPDNCPVKAIVVVGKYDRVIDVPKETAAMPSRFINPLIIEMEVSAHYPHIEEAEKIIQIISDKASGFYK